jgi:alpha-glucosidase
MVGTTRRRVCGFSSVVVAAIGAWGAVSSRGAKAGSPAPEAFEIASPNGQVKFVLSSDGGRLAFEASFGGRPIIERSPMRIMVDGEPLCEGVEFDDSESYEIDEQYPWRGVHSTAVNRCNGIKVRVKHKASGAVYVIDARAFDDGVAFRHIIPPSQSDAKPRVPDEATEFTLPAKSRVWYHDLEGHYEATYDSRLVEQVDEGQWIGPPMTFELPGGAGYASITEAALTNYSGMALQAVGGRKFKTVLGHAQPPSYPFRLRYEGDVERLKQPAPVAGTIKSPWRVVLIGADLNALVNSDVVHNLCPPPDPTLFPQGMATDWVKPGRAVWKYLDGGENSFEEMKNFSRLAGELGFEYHVIEGFWRRWSEEQIRELVEYSRERGVGLWFWRHSEELRSPEAREEFFALLERMGVVGAKIDFLDHEHKEIIDLYGELLRTAAKHKILVNFHGANKPTGEARTWPNELVREGVRGMEARRLRERAVHNTTLPFTRYLAGHGDYTPVVFGERRGDTTWAHQIATAAVFTEPLLTYGAHPQTLLANPALEMIKSIPATWDETIVLPQSRIGELVALARRAGDMWFVVVLNGPTRQSVSIPLGFLGEGLYEEFSVVDGVGKPEVLTVVNGETQATVTVELRNLQPGGGYISRLTPAR